jgi:UDP-N-acetylmuramoylalanine--D-glutamate ligase
MQDFKEYFKGKKVTVMGLGLLGRGVGDAIFLAECGAELIITDIKTKDQLKESINKLKKFNHTKGRAGNIKYTLGGHKLEDFRNRDMILKSAGVPLDSVYIAEAKKNKIPIEMSASFFTKISGLPCVGITGTRGKSTVTHLIAHILESAGKKILLGGNVRGVSNLQLLKKVKDKELVVLELDSWQLQGFAEDKISPNISVFTTFFPDHMGYYKGDMKKYFTDKASIFKYQKKGDILVVGKQALPFIKKWQKENKTEIKSEIIINKNTLPKGWVLSIPGEHNIYNATLAVEVARKLGIKDAVIKKALASFKGVPGRMEFIREVKGVKYYNDTTATTPEATIAALKALKNPKQGFGQKNIVLIMGGYDKGLDMSILVKEISKSCKKVILLTGSGTEKIKNKIKNHIEVDSLKKAVKIAREFAKKGDIILLSPAFASFGMFKNEYDRGDQFNKIIKNMGVGHP